MTLRQRVLLYALAVGVSTMLMFVMDWVWLALVNLIALIAFPFVINHWART